MEAHQGALVRRLEPADIAACMRLKEAAGWNQTEQDWRNVLELEPEGCLGLQCDGVLAATATAVCYERDLAWIGMVLTAPEFRRRGFARCLMERALQFLESRDVRWVKLDATDLGAPLYRQLGFKDECAVERWGRPGKNPGTLRADDAECSAYERSQACPPDFFSRATDWPAGFDPELDAEAFGADRTAVLWRVSSQSAFIPGSGFAMGRPGSRAAYFGPCVARSADTARSLLEWFLARHPGEEIFWDLLPSNTAARELALEFGFEPRRRLVRMALPGDGPPEPLAHDDALVFAIAGFEYG